MTERRPLPTSIAGIPVPQDRVSAGCWSWAQRALPAYLFAHSVRSYCWAAAIGAREGRSWDARIIWAASLVHDAGLTSLPANTMCFEVEGAKRARRLLLRLGLPFEEADRAAIAVILHMQPGVTEADGTEARLLDRATGLDVRGTEFEVVDAVRNEVVAAFPRGSFDRLFLAAIRREAAARPECQSARLLNEVGLAGWMARSPWRRETTREA